MPRPSVLLGSSYVWKKKQEQELECESRDREPETSRAAYLEMTIQIHEETKAWDTLDLSYSDGREREWSSGRRRWYRKEILETSMRPGRKL